MKIVKLAAVLLFLATALTGCQTTRVAPAEIDSSPWSTDGWVTVIRAIDNIDGTIHFHAGGGGRGFLEIQKIFVNNNPSATDAAVLFDFAAAQTHQEPGMGNLWWVNPELLGGIRDGGTENGRFMFASNGDEYRYGGGFGSPLLGENAYIGFVIRTDNGGNARFAFGGYPGHIVVPFRDMAD